jgi:UDP-N-acetylglucosamine acyltransferase
MRDLRLGWLLDMVAKNCIQNTMTNTLHPTAIVHPNARLGQNVTVGAYTIVEENVVIGDNVTLHSHVVLSGHTTLGAGCIVYPFAAIGLAPQDLKYKGEPATVEIGENTTIREHVTIHRGTAGGIMKTVVGSNCLLMVGVHLAHDCVIGNHVILANNVALAGHVVVGDFAVIGGLSAVHQWVRIGTHAMIGGMSAVESDVVPFATVMGERAKVHGINFVGLKRRGFSKEEMQTLRHAFPVLFRQTHTLKENIMSVEQEFGDSPSVATLLAFLGGDTSRAICPAVGWFAEGA